MSDPRIENLASILVDYSIGVKPGNWVVIGGNIVALPLIKEVTRRVLQAGGNYSLMLSDDEITEIRFRESSDEQLRWISPIEQLTVEKVDAYINLYAPSNTRAMSGVDPVKQRTFGVARQEIRRVHMQRSADKSLKWVVTQFPCPALAQDADMGLEDFEKFVYAATYADQPDPVRCWQEVHDRQEKLVKWLEGKQAVHVRGPNADIRLSIEGRKFLNADGKVNMPDGEIFTGPVEESANGWVRFTYPAIAGGREVEGVELKFEDGKVVQASAKKNQEFLLSQLDSDRGARYLGEFAVGTNYGIQRFTKSLLYDEKIGGSIHMAVGAGYPETGSKNESCIHWDFICDMRDDSEILVDGELFYKNGEFQI